MANETPKAPGKGGESKKGVGASGTDVNDVGRSDGNKVVVTFTNSPSTKTTVNRTVVNLGVGYTTGQGAQAAPPAAATAPDVPPVAERGVSPDCMDTVTRVQRAGVDLFKEGGEHAIEVYEKGFEQGKRCCPPPPAAPTQTTVQSESSGKWNWVRPALFIVLGAIIVWIAMNNMKGCNTVVAPAPEQTKSAADPCCPMTPDEVLELQRKTLEMTRKACEGCVSVTRTAPDGDYVDPDLDQRRRSRTTPPPTQTTYQVGEWKVADENLALRVLDCITRDRRNLRFVGSDSLDGERKEVLLAGVVATLVASGKGVKYVDDAPVVHQASYNAGFRGFCDQVSMMAHGIAKQGKYHNPEKDNTFNYWANSGVNPFDHNMETDFSVAVDETLEILFEALKKRGYNKEFNGVIIATASGSRQRHTSGRGAVTSTPSPSPHAHKRMTTIPDGFYMRPTASHKWDDDHWDGKSSAVDMFAAKGTPVYASAAGKVIRSGNDEGRSGLRVTIRDQYADVLYAHLDKIHVKLGEYVQQGQLIGTVGNTGSAKGGNPHLHFEFFKVRKGVIHSRPWTKWSKVGQKRRT